VTAPAERVFFTGTPKSTSLEIGPSRTAETMDASKRLLLTPTTGEPTAVLLLPVCIDRKQVDHSL